MPLHATWSHLTDRVLIAGGEPQVHGTQYTHEPDGSNLRPQPVADPGRGSATGSLVAYATRITERCPLEHGLLFERFLNPERVSPPDVDLDFDDRRRDAARTAAGGRGNRRPRPTRPRGAPGDAVLRTGA